MACQAKSDMIADIFKRVKETMIKENPEMKIAVVNTKSKEAANKIFERANDLASQEVFSAESMTPAIRENASKAVPLAKDKQPFVPISKEVELLTEQFNNNKTNENFAKLLNAEIAHGYRNANGESLVRLTKRREQVLGSDEAVFSTPLTHEEFEAAYVDTDGTMSKSVNYNNAFIALDKKNAGENFDQDHSDRLTSLLATIATSMKNINDTDIRITKASLVRSEALLGAGGTFDTTTGDVEILLDTHGAAADFRKEHSMTNQEAYLHELTHAAINFMFDTENRNVSKDVDVVMLKNALEQLYAKAKKESTWETLLPGDTNSYNEHAIEAAKAKWKYIFNNEAGNGLHEFAAGIMTNKMFREGMRQIGTLDTKRMPADAKAIDKIHAWFMNVLEKIFGYATNKRNNSVTDEGVRLITDIMRANSNAVNTVANSQMMATASKHLDKAAEVIEATNEQVKQFTDPLIGFMDYVKSDVESNGRLDDEGIAEFIKLKNKLDKKLVNPYKKNTGGKLHVLIQDTIDSINNIVAFIGSLHTIYKMRKLAGHTKAYSNAADIYAKTLNKMLESINLTHEGFVRGTLGGFFDKPGLYNQLADSLLRLTQSVDNAREKTYEGVLSQSNGWFEDVHINNDSINQANNTALNDVLLRTDIQSLGLSVEELTELLRDPDKVSSKIDELKEGLDKNQILDAESLATYMVHGTGTGSNARNIAAKFGHSNPNLEVDDKVITQVDHLVSYMALEATNESSKKQLLDFISGELFVDYSTTAWAKAKKVVGFTGTKPLTRKEYEAKVKDGVAKFIVSTRGLQKASSVEMRGNPHNVIKGYVKETFNSDYALEFQPMYDRARLEKDGYTFIRQVDKVDGSTVEYGMFISNVPAVKRANGALGLQDRKARGFSLKDMIQRESELSTESWDSGKRDKEFKKALRSIVEKYQSNPASVNMHPMYDQFGNIVNFRATMSYADKLKYLKLETRGTVNLARSYATMGTASATSKHNELVIDMLYNDKVNNFNDNEEDYVHITPASLTAEDYGLTGTISTNKDYERLWARLPASTKAYAAKKFGSKGIYIRKDMLTIAFGEDDWSVTQMKALDNVSPKTKAILRKAERVWQETMQIAKANIVIKTPEVLMGNIWSNFKILLYIGVHPVVGAKLILAGARELKKYEADKKELGLLLRDQLSGINVDKIRITELTKAIKDNTVAPLIDAGLYQSIVEDVSTADESNRVAQWFTEKTDKFIPNETANTAIQYLFMTQRTKPYQQLLKLTQVSDFYFRYAQYYNAIDNKGHSKERALRDAIDNYINYEAPLEKHIRYGDAMGTWFFVKYFVRIQKVIKKIAKENPVRMGADIFLQTFLYGDTADIQDASFFDKGLSTYNPFNILNRLWEVVMPSGIEVHKALLR